MGRSVPEPLQPRLQSCDRSPGRGGLAAWQHRHSPCGGTRRSRGAARPWPTPSCQGRGRAGSGAGFAPGRLRPEQRGQTHSPARSLVSPVLPGRLPPPVRELRVGGAPQPAVAPEQAKGSPRSVCLVHGRLWWAHPFGWGPGERPPGGRRRAPPQRGCWPMKAHRLLPERWPGGCV